MNKVMIVDDELLVRNDLCSLLDWEEHGFVICGEAANGLSALELIRDRSPQIVVLDIHMPGMDGVQLCKEIARLYPEIKIIVLSSHDNYDYVRETLKEGAVDYLLKHRMNAEHLLEILERVAGIISKQELLKSEEARRSQSWNTIQLSAIRNDLRDWIMGMEERKEATLLDLNQYFFKYAGDDPRISVVALQIANYPLMEGMESELEKNRFMRSLTDLCQQCIPDDMAGIVAPLEQGAFILLLAFPDSMRSENQMLSALNRVTQRIDHSIRLAMNLRMLQRFSPVLSNLRDVTASYQSARFTLEKESGTTACLAGHPSYPNQSDCTLTIQQEKELLGAIEQSNSVHLEQLLRNILSSVRNSSSRGFIVRELIGLAGKVGRKLGGSQLQLAEKCRRILLESSQEFDWEEMMGWIVTLFCELVDHSVADQLDGTNHSAHVRSAIRYAFECYQRPLTLEEVADHTGISPSYLSRIFREETGIPFIEYLNGIRIKKSLKIMEAGNRRITEIYQKVGFSNYNYFFKVFKQSTGVTPKEYLNSLNK